MYLSKNPNKVETQNPISNQVSFAVAAQGKKSYSTENQNN